MSALSGGAVEEVRPLAWGRLVKVRGRLAEGQALLAQLFLEQGAYAGATGGMVGTGMGPAGRWW